MNRPWLTLLLALAGLVSSPARAEDTVPPRIIHEACAAYMKGRAFTIIARFEDESRIFEPKALYRSGSESYWKQVAFVKDPASGVFTATIKARDLKGVLRYFIEVFDEFGNGPARIGSPEDPIKVRSDPSPAPCNQSPAAEMVGATTGSAPTGADEGVEVPVPKTTDAFAPPQERPVTETSDHQKPFSPSWQIGVAAGGVATAITGGAALWYGNRVATDANSSGDAKERAVILGWLGLSGIVVGIVTAGVTGYFELTAPLTP